MLLCTKVMTVAGSIEWKGARIILGKLQEESLNEIIRAALRIRETGERIAFLSEQFLGVAYVESTLIGGADRLEIFVINLEGVDCFTLIDYVEALRLSSSFEQFKENLRRVRYQFGKVAYMKRNHFFTDWIGFNKRFVEDVTGQIGGQMAKKVEKTLNLKEDGTFFLEGISTRKQEISYIPTGGINETVTDRLMTGDYAGIYSEKAGLDVSHAGIIIKKEGTPFLRHASSLDIYRKVIDQHLHDYLENKPGLVVLRPRDINL